MLSMLLTPIMKPSFILTTRIFLISVIICFLLLCWGCRSSTTSLKDSSGNDSSEIRKREEQQGVKAIETIRIADAATILLRKQVPILCYHQVRDYRLTDSKIARDYIVPPAVFGEQMKTLADSGYKTILPDELYAYMADGAAIPEKALMLSFDDTDLEQFTVAVPEMEKYGFKGVFFIMTVSLGRPDYMNKEQVKQLADKGHIIGSHTWDHHNVKKYAEADWVTQIEKPSKLLETITGSKLTHFAYPFGLWNKEAIPELKKRGFKAAFQLSMKRDQTDPLFTIRRIIVPGSLDAQAMLKRMKVSF